MTNAHDFDVVVIGGGIGGFVSAVTANSLGKRVAIVEKRKVGGNCTNFTCIPSKALIRASHVNRELTHLDDMGLKRPFHDRRRHHKRHDPYQVRSAESLRKGPSRNLPGKLA